MKKNNLINSKGISVIFLVIAMLLMVIIGYVFSYLIPSKQKSVVFPIQSTQAFFIAQSGVEFAVRLASDNGWTTTALLNSNLNIAPNNTRTLGPGRFILSYSNVAPNLDTLISVGEVSTGTPRRSIRVSNFTRFVQQVLIIDPNSPAPYWFNPRTGARFYIKNIGSSSVTLTRFSASWNEPPDRHLTGISMTLGGVANNVFTGAYDTGTINFTPPGNTQTIDPTQVITVDLFWDKNIKANNTINIYFYDTNGNMYTFTFLLA